MHFLLCLVGLCFPALCQLRNSSACEAKQLDLGRCGEGMSVRWCGCKSVWVPAVCQSEPNIPFHCPATRHKPEAALDSTWASMDVLPLLLGLLQLVWLKCQKILRPVIVSKSTAFYAEPALPPSRWIAGCQGNACFSNKDKTNCKK